MATTTCYTELPYRDTAELFAELSKQSGCVFLDSSLTTSRFGRYSFIGIEPEQWLVAEGNQIRLNGQLIAVNNPLEYLQNWLAKQPSSMIDIPVPFYGGWMGYWGYECLHYLERIKHSERDKLSLPDVVLGLYTKVYVFDHQAKQTFAFANNQQTLDNLIETYKQCPEAKQTTAANKPLNFKANFDKQKYLNTIQKVIDAIHQGELFQANITQRFTAQIPTDFSANEAYLHLRDAHQADFSGYFDFAQGQLLSISPERFFKVQGQLVETCPIKGTRPRHKDLTIDNNFALQLINSEKDNAENIMIVDLMRNDLSRCCEPNSVHTPEVCALQSFSRVHHLVSTVTGKLQNSKTAIDVLQSCFPGGSITGAPKVRAMEMIQSLETCRRGPYCGSLGYLGSNGNLDLSILIRTLIRKNDYMFFHVGGGIVADSEPQAEYQECLDKARPFFECFAGAYDFTD